MVDAALTASGLPEKLVDGGEIAKGENNAAERLMPFNSYIGIRQMLEYVINPPQ